MALCCFCKAAMNDDNTIDRELDLRLAAAMGITVYYHEWDGSHEMPLYIPSGKPWKTHSLEAKRLPNYHGNYGAAFALLDMFKELTAFKLERGISPWWWCGIAFSMGVSAKGEGRTAPVAICNAVLAGLEIYPAVPLASLSHQQLLAVCKKRHLKGWDQSSSTAQLLALLSASAGN